MAIDKVAEALEQFVNAEDYDESRQILDQNPDLLGDEAQELLSESISDYRQAERDDVADYLQEHLVVLQRSREVGADQAFVEANQRAEKAEADKVRELNALRPASPVPMQAIIWQVIDAQSPEEVEQILSSHPELTDNQDALSYLDGLIRQAQQADYRQALRYLQEYHDLLAALYELPPVMRALREFIAAPTWTGSADVLKASPDLLSIDGLTTIDQVIQRARGEGDEDAVETLEVYRQVLQRSLEVGPDKAVEEMLENQQA